MNPNKYSARHRPQAEGREQEEARRQWHGHAGCGHSRRGRHAGQPGAAGQEVVAGEAAVVRSMPNAAPVVKKREQVACRQKVVVKALC
jgi:hypothetical protein